MSTSTDFNTLGRLGTASGTLSGGTLRRRSTLRGGRTVRRGRPSGSDLPNWRVVAGVVGLVLVVLFVLGTTAQSQLDKPAPSASQVPTMDPVLEASLLSGGTQMAATGSRTLIPGGGSTAGMVEVPSAFAAVEDLALHLPSRDHGGVVFTEADSVDALALAPVGAMVGNDNPEGYEATNEFDGPEYHVAEAVTGVRPATGMARVLLPPAASMLSPLTGQVTAVEEYSTADGGRDWRVTIQPATRSDLQVIVRRLEQPAVTVGQEVGVGQTELGRVRVAPPTPTPGNPEGLPSAWITVRPAIEDLAVDPHAPAVAPSTVGD